MCAKQLPTSSNVNIALVDQAYDKLSAIFCSHFEQAMIEAGEYLINTFYGGDIERAREKKPTEEGSFFQLIQRLQQSDSNSPSKSWIYNAVKLVIDKHDYSSFHTYGKVPVSQRVLLLPVKDKALKQTLMLETVDKGYSARDLKKRIAEEFRAPARKKGLASFIRTPDQLFSEEFTSQYDAEYFRKLPPANKKVLREKTLEQIEGLSGELEKTFTRIEKYESLIRSLRTRPKKKKKSDKPKTGTLEWAGDSVNCTTGCLNDCLYCYAKYDAVKLHKKVSPGQWPYHSVRQGDVLADRKYLGDVMFPSTHDIFPDNLYAYLIVLEKLLKSGNRVLIVSKPRIECIKAICSHSERYKKQILFRFTIGAMDDSILSFWEPHAPAYAERKDALVYAYEKGFSTSVSAEPMLDTAHVGDLIGDLVPYITDTIWLGKMNYINSRVEVTGNAVKKAIQQIKDGQTDDKIIHIYERFKNHPKVDWKYEIRKVVGIAESV